MSLVVLKAIDPDLFLVSMIYTLKLVTSCPPKMHLLDPMGGGVCLSTIKTNAEVATHQSRLNFLAILSQSALIICGKSVTGIQIV
jgi:hypothetical protein